MRRRACVIHRVVDSWLGMLPPEEEPAAKYTQRAGAACTLGGRGRRCACTLLEEPPALTQPRSFGAKTSKGGAAAYP